MTYGNFLYHMYHNLLTSYYYTFVVDKIQNKEVKIIYCPTDDMIADFSSKPIQGLVFKQQRNIIMGLIEDVFPMC